MKEYYTGDPKLHKELEQKVGKRLRKATTVRENGTVEEDWEFGTDARNAQVAVTFEYEYYETMAAVRERVQQCEGRHSQQIAYSSFHDCLTQICFGCKKVRTNKKL